MDSGNKLRNSQAITKVVSNTLTNLNKPHTIIIKVQLDKEIPKFDGSSEGVEPYCAIVRARWREMIAEGVRDPDTELMNRVSVGMETSSGKL